MTNLRFKSVCHDIFWHVTNVVLVAGYQISTWQQIGLKWGCISTYTSSTAQGGGGSFKNRKPIGEVGCCESGMAERSHWWTERCLISLILSLSLALSLSFSLSLTINLPTYLPIYLSISIYLCICQAIYISIYLSIYLLCPAGSAPAVLASSRICIFFLLTLSLLFFSLLIFLFSLPLPCFPLTRLPQFFYLTASDTKEVTKEVCET